jgi:transcriptional regulator with XRE-family HTH domain
MSIWRHTTSDSGVPRRRSRRTAEAPAFPTLEPFAQRLERLRLERGLTQRALAARARISTNYYQDIAHAQANPTVLALLRLADALGVPLRDLFDSPAAPPDELRTVRAEDLGELAATHERLTAIVERLASRDMWPERRNTKRHEQA